MSIRHLLVTDKMRTRTCCLIGRWPGPTQCCLTDHPMHTNAPCCPLQSPQNCSHTLSKPPPYTYKLPAWCPCISCVGIFLRGLCQKCRYPCVTHKRQLLTFPKVDLLEIHEEQMSFDECLQGSYLDAMLR